ncbi:MAG TPA: hypothetical protein VHA56_18740 [Mucilaginibacter sp.]|nr:hypothetical protein [Mucilaginibacter sp.]
MAGKYKRLKITNWNSITQQYDDITHRYEEGGYNNNIELEYCGEGEYKGTVRYEKGTVGIVINMNKENPDAGKGTYQYKTNDAHPDLGTYEIQKDQNDVNMVYVNYSNVISSDWKNSGKVQGYEIWRKIK